MGDRALVIFTAGEETSPIVYLHWSGKAVPEMILTLAEVMHDRKGDAHYAAARFAAIACERCPGNLSVGMMNLPEKLQVLIGAKAKGMAKELRELSHGDAGVIVVDTRDFSWKGYGGYLTPPGDIE